MSHIENIQYCLTNKENYKKTLKSSLDQVLQKYLMLVNEYLEYISENFEYKNDYIFKYTLTIGLETITNVFNMLLINTYNLDVTYYNSQKSYYYFIEFITQITNIQNINTNANLNLSTKDAIMYVYKKTLFKLDNKENKERKKSPDFYKESEKTIFKTLITYQKIFKTIINNVLEKISFENIETIKHLQIIENIYKICKKINNKVIENKNIFNNLNEINKENTCINNYISNLNIFFNFN